MLAALSSANLPVDDFLFRFAQAPSQTSAVLTLLKVFPEENDSRYLRLGANRRKAVFEELASQTPTVVAYLVS